MTTRELNMVDLLKRLKAEGGVSAIKASMEAEGISLSELAITSSITARAGVGFSVKIGGCEAITDARLAAERGVSIIMAPMIESRFALEKFLAMADAVFPQTNDGGPLRFINIETQDGCGKMEDILRASGVERLNGIVVGRTDLSATMGEKDVNSPAMFEASRRIGLAARAKGVSCLIGGGICEKSVPFLRALGDAISGFETRKVVFERMPESEEALREAIRAARSFELRWHESRREAHRAALDDHAARAAAFARD